MYGTLAIFLSTPRIMLAAYLLTSLFDPITSLSSSSEFLWGSATASYQLKVHIRRWSWDDCLGYYSTLQGKSPMVILVILQQIIIVVILKIFN